MHSCAAGSRYDAVTILLLMIRPRARILATLALLLATDGQVHGLRPSYSKPGLAVLRARQAQEIMTQPHHLHTPLAAVQSGSNRDLKRFIIHDRAVHTAAPQPQPAMRQNLAVSTGPTLSTLSQDHSGGPRCPAGCTDKGVCNAELGRCDCQRGWRGPDCSIAPNTVEMARTCLNLKFRNFEGNCTDTEAVKDSTIFCVNNCNGRGRCRAGWCHCQPGFWGMDCSLSQGPDGKTKILAGMGYKLRQKRPSIYVYDLPHRLTTWINPTYTDRPLHIHFYQRLLAAGVLTADPSQADYFLFPLLLRRPSDGIVLENAVEYVKTYWPYWDQLQGRRHLAIHTGDMGRAELFTQTQRLIVNMTLLTHWGLTQDVPEFGWRRSHIENQDIVIPVYISSLAQRAAGMQASPFHPGSDSNGTVDKNIELLFAGRVCGGREMPNGRKVPNCRPVNTGYSQGVRQRVHQHHWNRTGFVINVTVPNYFEKLTRTRFCLAPSGGGHGHRQILVAYSGCTPLVISDNVLQPFAPALNWSRFAVTLPEASIPELHTILPTINNSRYHQLQAALPCAAQHLAWSSVGGAFMAETGRYDAFETTLEILRMMLKYPNTPHKDFESTDPEFRDFMQCSSQEPVPQQTAGQASAVSASVASQEQSLDAPQGTTTNLVHPSQRAAAGVSAAAGEVSLAAPYPSEPGLCSMSQWDGQTCEPCQAYWKRVVPGGSLCCGYTDNLAQCPRMWA